MTLPALSRSWGPHTLLADSKNKVMLSRSLDIEKKVPKVKPAKYMPRRIHKKVFCLESLKEKENRLRKEIDQLKLRIRTLEDGIARNNKKKIKLEALARRTHPSPPKYAPNIPREQLKRLEYLRKNSKNIRRHVKIQGTYKDVK